jgi:hypothetical protein
LFAHFMCLFNCDAKVVKAARNAKSQQMNVAKKLK